MTTSQSTPDTGYLQHGEGTKGPFRTESVRVRNDLSGRWYAYYAGSWRKVHTKGLRTYIVVMHEKITILIDGV